MMMLRTPSIKSDYAKGWSLKVPLKSTIKINKLNEFGCNPLIAWLTFQFAYQLTCIWLIAKFFIQFFGLL